MIETWLPAPGFERFYSVSNLGNVRSNLNNKRRILAHVMDGRGYPTVKLSLQGKTSRQKVHRLVCRAFHGPPSSPELDVAHLDGQRDNPRADNLIWATRGENMAHAVQHGTHRGFTSEAVSGALHPRSKLSADDVAMIRSRLAEGEKQAVIARAFGVGRSTINDIAKNKKWIEPVPVSPVPASINYRKES